MPGLIKASFDTLTRRNLRFKIEENKYGFTGSIYYPKEKFKDKKYPKEILIKVAFNYEK